MNKIIETVKTIVITALAVGILSFVMGVRYQSHVAKATAQVVIVTPQPVPAATVSK